MKVPTFRAMCCPGEEDSKSSCLSGQSSGGYQGPKGAQTTQCGCPESLAFQKATKLPTGLTKPKMLIYRVDDDAGKRALYILRENDPTVLFFPQLKALYTFLK